MNIAQNPSEVTLRQPSLAFQLWGCTDTTQHDCPTQTTEGKGARPSPAPVVQGWPAPAAPGPREPYLVWVRAGDDPHTLCVVFILNRVVRGGDDATGPTQI